MKSRKLIQTASLLVALTGIARAQWTVTNLHPAGATRSEIQGVTGTSQYGYAIVAGVTSASTWSGTPTSWVNLHPQNAAGSVISGSDGSIHYGQVIAPNGRAAMWVGNSTNWTNLNPFGAAGSAISAAVDGRQVGIAGLNNTAQAGLWSGTPGSFVNLNPIGAVYSEAYGIGGNQQVGYVQLNGSNSIASLWTGTPESWKSLNPFGATSSWAYATSGFSQVGMVNLPGNRASLWYGSADSWVDLSPNESTQSSANGVSGIYQVGHTVFGNSGSTRASLWRGSSSSWVNLHSMLPTGFSSSYAVSVYSDSSKVIVGGSGSNSNGTWQALIWTFPIRRISGNMTLENTTGQGEAGTEAINWTLGCGSNTYTGVVNVNQLGGGPYSIEIPPGTPNGVYTLQFKGGTFLSSSYVVNLNGNNITRTIRLRNGDIDQDGEVGPGDFEAVVGQFGGPGSADADNDGEVGPSDFEIVVGNFGLQDQ
jgi:hypothetical protein